LTSSQKKIPWAQQFPRASSVRSPIKVPPKDTLVYIRVDGELKPDKAKVIGPDPDTSTKGKYVLVDYPGFGKTSVHWKNIELAKQDKSSMSTTTTPTKLTTALDSSALVSTEELKIEDKVEVRGRDGQSESGVVDTIEDDVVYVRYQSDINKTPRATPRKFVRKLDFSNTGSTPETNDGRENFTEHVLSIWDFPWYLF